MTWERGRPARIAGARRWWRGYMKDAPSHKPREVNGGPLLENIAEGKAVDIGKIPTPVWHEHDGCAFIGIFPFSYEELPQGKATCVRR